MYRSLDVRRILLDVVVDLSTQVQSSNQVAEFLIINKDRKEEDPSGITFYYFESA